MEYVAHLGTLQPDERTQVIKNFFPAGVLDADCMGLQCIGFNRTLYDALLRRSSGIKREADQIEPEEGRTVAKRARS
jgi:hypothetical protein